MASAASDAERESGARMEGFFVCSKPKGRHYCSRDELARVLGVSVSQVPAGNGDGVLSRDDFLAWLLGKPAGSPGLFGEAVNIRASVLRALAASLPKGASLEQVWPGGAAHPRCAEVTDAEEALWQRCLLAFGAAAPAEANAASHLAKVAEAGFDVNKVLFPAQEPRNGFPKPRLLSENLGDKRDVNDLPFTLPGESNSASTSISATTEAEQEADRAWRAGLVRAEELRHATHHDTAALDMVLQSWPMAPMDLVKEDKCTEGQIKAGHSSRWWSFETKQASADPAFFAENRWVRAQMHSNLKMFDMELKPWPTMEDGIIASDLCTPQQERFLARRATRGPLSPAAMEGRRDALRKRFCSNVEAQQGWPHPAFFEEVRPILEKEASLAEMRLRWAADRFRESRERDERADIGAQMVSWPIERTGCWPKVAPEWTQRCRWFAMWRRSRLAAQAEARKMAKLSAVPAPLGLRRSRSSSSSKSDASWEVVSVGSDASWEQVQEPEIRATRWLDVATEANLTAQIEAKVAEVSTLKEACQKDSQATQPTLQASMEALSALSAADLREVKAMASPPSAVILVSEAMCHVFGINSLPKKQPMRGYWGAAKKHLWGDVRLMQRLASYDMERISNAMMLKLAPLMNDPGFDPESVKKASCAAAGICKWVRALFVYKQVADCVAPRRAALARAEADLAAARAALKEKTSGGSGGAPLEAPVPDPDTVAVVEYTVEEAEALLKKAKACLDCICKADITEIKSFKHPPHLVMITMAAVATLMNKSPPTWSTSKAMLADVSFLGSLLNFDIGSVTDSTLRKLQRYTKDPTFTFECVSKVSKAAAGLCQWVRAVVLVAQLTRTMDKTEGDAAVDMLTSPCTTAPSSPMTKSCGGSSAPSPAPSPSRKVPPPEVEDLGGTLKRSAIHELKSLSKPPAQVAAICEVVMHLQAGINPEIEVDENGFVKDCSWKAAQKMMANPNSFLKRLDSLKACVDNGTLPRRNVERALEVQRQMGEDFSYSHARMVSAAAASLCAWVLQLEAYYTVSTDVPF